MKKRYYEHYFNTSNVSVMYRYIKLRWCTIFLHSDPSSKNMPQNKENILYCTLNYREKKCPTLFFLVFSVMCHLIVLYSKFAKVKDDSLALHYETHSPLIPLSIAQPMNHLGNRSISLSVCQNSQGCHVTLLSSDAEKMRNKCKTVS